MTIYGDHGWDIDAALLHSIQADVAAEIHWAQYRV